MYLTRVLWAVQKINAIYGVSDIFLISYFAQLFDLIMIMTLENVTYETEM